MTFEQRNEIGAHVRKGESGTLVVYADSMIRFYTEILGSVRKEDVPMGEHCWLTVVSPFDPNGVERVLEPDAHPAAKPFKAALLADGISYASFGADDNGGCLYRNPSAAPEVLDSPFDARAIWFAVVEINPG